MKLSCPACGATASLDVLIVHEGARTAVRIALSTPAPLGNLLVQYLGLFRPAQRPLTMDRVATLLGELHPLIDAARISRNGLICSAPLDYWVRAMEEMLAKRDTLTLPLKSHGYLLTIIAGYGDKAAARKEQQHEDRLAGRTPVGGQTPPNPPLTKGGAQNAGDSKPRAKMPAEVLAAAGITKSNTVGDNDGNNQ